MPKIWEFYPDLPYERRRKAYVPTKSKTDNQVWIAPEHGKMVRDMVRDFPKDDFGLPMKNRPKELVLDKRPNIMIPPRPTYKAF